MCDRSDNINHLYRVNQNTCYPSSRENLSFLEESQSSQRNEKKRFNESLTDFNTDCNNNLDRPSNTGFKLDIISLEDIIFRDEIDSPNRCNLKKIDQSIPGINVGRHLNRSSKLKKNRSKRKWKRQYRNEIPRIIKRDASKMIERDNENFDSHYPANYSSFDVRGFKSTSKIKLSNDCPHCRSPSFSLNIPNTNSQVYKNPEAYLNDRELSYKTNMNSCKNCKNFSYSSIMEKYPESFDWTTYENVDHSSNLEACCCSKKSGVCSRECTPSKASLFVETGESTLEFSTSWSSNTNLPNVCPCSNESSIIREHSTMNEDVQRDDGPFEKEEHAMTDKCRTRCKSREFELEPCCSRFTAKEKCSSVENATWSQLEKVESKARRPDYDWRENIRWRDVGTSSNVHSDTKRARCYESQMRNTPEEDKNPKCSQRSLFGDFEIGKVWSHIQDSCKNLVQSAITNIGQAIKDMSKSKDTPEDKGNEISDSLLRNSKVFFDKECPESCKLESTIMTATPTKVEPLRVLQREKDVVCRKIGLTEGTAQQKICPVITTREIAVTTEPKEVSPSMMLLMHGCGPGLGQGCEGNCSCVPGKRILLRTSPPEKSKIFFYLVGIQIRDREFYYDKDFCSLSVPEKKLFPRFYVTRHGSRLRGGGSKDSRKTKMPRIRCRRKKNSVLQVESSLRRPKEDPPCRGFHRSLSSLRGQPAWMEEAQESCWESCLRSKNCVGRASVSAECVPSSYNYGTVVPDVPERRWNFRRKQNIMAAGSTSCSRKFRRVTTATPLVPSAISMRVRENVGGVVGNKYRRYYSIWETLGLIFKSSSRRKNTKSDIARKTRTNRPNRRLLNIPVIGNTILRSYCKTKNRSPFFSKSTKGAECIKSYKDKDFSKETPLRENSSSSSSLSFKLEEKEDRLRGGGNKCDLEDKHKHRHAMEFTDQSAMENPNDIEMKPLHNNKDDNVSNAMFWENMDEDEYSWTHNPINEDVLRLQEDQECCDGPEHRNEDRRIRGGCGRSYKPIQHWTIFGRRDHSRGSCCSPVRPQVSCRSSPCSPPPCLRPPICTPMRFHNRSSCGRPDPCLDRKGCPCNSCGGSICSDEITRCCRVQQKELPYASANLAKLKAFDLAVDAVVNPVEGYTVVPVAVVVPAVSQEIPEDDPVRNAAVAGIRTAEDAAKNRTIPESCF
ncbi:hypothetical protein HZH66_007583 [Vespula vulgaris]|uniref:Uncharacterized protein n=1 Tax=Vespula vulgaris TaxID=7454 RepID=A0A834K3R3_VESVU|nr:hypothetical protein HZH66_007583 [Vespula vulgaris]